MGISTEMALAISLASVNRGIYLGYFGCTPALASLYAEFQDSEYGHLSTLHQGSSNM